MLKSKIRILVIDDSMIFRESVSRCLSADPDIEVVGTAADPIEAMSKIEQLKPTLLTLDVHMPKMNGIDFLKKLMAESPMPVVVVSSVSENVFDALNAGAVEFVTKPTEGRKVDLFAKELIVKAKIASVAKLKVSAGKTAPARPTAPARSAAVPEREKTAPSSTARQVIKPVNILSKPVLKTTRDDVVVAIGASTGGTEAILAVIKDLPANMPGIVIVQHMPPGFTAMYAKRANNICNMEVKEAETGDYIERGKVLIAPGALQMRVKKDSKGYYVKCEPGEKVSGHAPSVDVLFDSVAETIGAKAVGIILTGMGSDGAKGLLNMKKKGSYTIGQDEKSCVVYGMPKVSYNIGAVAVQAELEAIPGVLMNFLNK